MGLGLKGILVHFKFLTYDASTINLAKEAKSCEVDGETYKDGEEFKMGCKMLCTCQNGQHACSTLCPQEDRQPSRLHCREPRLIEIQGQCCKEWTCPIHYQPRPYTSEESGAVGRCHKAKFILSSRVFVFYICLFLILLFFCGFFHTCHGCGNIVFRFYQSE